MPNLPWRKPKRQLVNLTPMLDAVLIIVAFLLVVAQYSHIEGKIKVSLPKGGTKASSPSKWAEISITTEPALFYSSYKQTEPTKIQAWQIPNFLMKDTPEFVSIRADKNVMFAIVVRVLDIVNKFGIQNVSITTQVEE